MQKKGIFVGYDWSSPVYLVYYSENRKVLKHSQVKFINIIAEQQTQTYQPNDYDDDLPLRDLTKNPKSEEPSNKQSSVENKLISRRIAILKDIQNGNRISLATWVTVTKAKDENDLALINIDYCFKATNL